MRTVLSISARTKTGDKVRFAFPEKGSITDKQKAHAHLRTNKIYTVSDVLNDVVHTRLWLKEFPDVQFNGSQFTNV